MTALCNQTQAFASDLGDDQSHCLCVVFCFLVLLSVLVQLIAWKVSEMTCYVSSGMLNATHSLRFSCQDVISSRL